MYDVLCDDIRRGRLRPKEQRKLPLWLMPGLYLLILPDDIQCVHLLALILVQPLYLYIEDGLRVQLHPGPLLHILAELRLFLPLDSQQLAKRRRVVLERQQLFKLVRVLLPAVPYLPGDKIAQLRVAVHEPAPEGHAVGLIVELLRVYIREAL